MRIAINAMLLSRCESGVEYTLAQIIRAMAASAAAAEHQFHLFLPAATPFEPPIADNWSTTRLQLPRCRRLVRVLWEQLRLPRRLRELKSDLLHAPAYLAPLRTSVPVVLTVHDLIALRFPQWCRWTNAANYRLLLPPSIRRAACLLVPSKSTQNDIEARFPEVRDRLRVVPFAVDHTRFRPVADKGRLETLRDKYHLPARFVLFVGQHEPKKNLPVLVRAFLEMKQHSDLPHGLVLAGARGWGCYDVDKLLAAHPTATDIVRPGYISDADLPTLYSLADLFVFPSLYEGFGLPPLEAMACGTPVLVSNRGALPEVAGDAALAVAPESPIILAAAMHGLLTADARRRDLAERGLRRAAEFTWERTAAATLEAYSMVDLQATFQDLGTANRR